jgi:CubicO group peptidase (beta-lactamase class C family)
MEEFNVPALSVAVIQGNDVFYQNLGIVDSQSQKPVDDKTVFRAVSLGMPVFAYLVAKLADEGLIDLDKPLYKYLKHPLPEYPDYQDLKNYPNYKRLTARLILSHQSGLPNRRQMNQDQQLDFKFSPGKHFGFSGEGYRLLQFVLEELTGRTINDLANEKVFNPLGMTHSRFIWERRFDGNIAMNPEAFLDPRIRRTRDRANVADSFLTNASDYAQFLRLEMRRMGLSLESWISLFKPEIRITSKSLFSPPKTEDRNSKVRGLSWTLGWGMFQSPHAEVYFHGGREKGCENYVVNFIAKKKAIVVLSVTTNGKTFTALILKNLLGDTFSPLKWLEY